MPPRVPPKPDSLLVACYPFNGSITSAARHGVVQWNDRGQCLVMTNKEVVVLTPHAPNASTAHHASVQLPAPPVVPLIYDNTSEWLPAVPRTHALLPLHVSRVPVAAWQWTAHAPTPEVQATWDAQGGWDAQGARAALGDALVRGVMGRIKGEAGAGAARAQATVYGETPQASDLNVYYPPSAIALRAFAPSPLGMPDNNGVGAPCVVVLDNMLNVSVRRAGKGDVVSGEWEMAGDLTREAFLLDAPPGFTKQEPPARRKRRKFDAAGNVIGEDTPEGDAEPLKTRGKVGGVQEKAKAAMDVDRAVEEGAESPESGRGAARKQKTELQLEMSLQAMCLAWSPAPAFAEPYGAMPEASLLAVGDRGGRISVWSVEPRAARQPGMSGLKRIWNEQVGSAVVSHVAWSPWVQAGLAAVSATLAWATTNGQVHRMRVAREIRGEDGVVTTDVGAKQTADCADARPVNSLGWAHGCLIATKVASVFVFKGIGTQRSVAPEVIRLQQRGDWAGCASSSPCSGIIALPGRTIMIIASSGEVHILRDLGASERTTVDEAASIKWQVAVRTALVDAVAGEQQRVARESSVRVQGCDGLYCQAADGAFLLGLVFEPLNLHDLSVERESTRSHYICMLDCSSLLPDEQHRNSALRNGMQSVQGNDSVQQAARATHAHAEMISFLPAIYRAKAGTSNPAWTFLDGVALRRKSEETDPFTGAQSRGQLLTRLRWELVNDPALQAQQRGLMWNTWTSLSGVDLQTPPGALLGPVPNRLQDVLRLNLLFVSAGSKLYPAADRSNTGLVTRLLCALDIYRDLEQDAVLRAQKAMLTVREDNPPREECLFCQDELLLERTDCATMKQSCEQGHVWTRCSLTWRLLTTPHVRSCAVCNLKSAIPLPPTRTNTAPSFEQDVLNAATCCAVCGGPWLQLV